MKVCPSCCAEDIPDAATHCKHCGRRIKSLHLAAVIPLLLFILLLLSLFARKGLEALAHAQARDDAHRLIDQAKLFCTPAAPESVVNAMSEEIEAKIDKLDLDYLEKSNFRNLFENQLEVLGCGTNARNQVKPKKRR